MLKLKSCGDEISQKTIWASCNQVAERFRRVVKAKGERGNEAKEGKITINPFL